jgi:hypothetical protein
LDVSRVPKAPDVTFILSVDRSTIRADPPGGSITISATAADGRTARIQVVNALTDETFADIESSHVLAPSIGDDWKTSTGHVTEIAASLYWSMWRRQQVDAIKVDDTGRRIVAGDVGFAGDALEYAWGVIANAFGGDWTKASGEWQHAAARFRDHFWHPWLDAHGYTSREPAVRHTKRDLMERLDSCLGKSKPDEPVFLLCGRDPHGPAGVRAWATAYFNAGGKHSKSDDALDCARQMEEWRVENVEKPEQAELKRQHLAVRTSETNRILRVLASEGIDERILERVRNEHDSAAAPGEG